MDETTLCCISEEELYPVADVVAEGDPYWYVHANFPARHVNIPTEIIKEYKVVYQRWEELNAILIDYKYKANKYGQ